MASTRTGFPKTGGRQKGTPNRATADVKAAAQQHTVAAIAELARLALGAESEAARVSAIKELLDRGHGRSPQAITGAGGGEFGMTIRWASQDEVQ